MDNSPPAFGHFVPDGHYNSSMHFEGLTKREWFAGMAMQSFVNLAKGTNATQKMIAEDSIKLADAILKELDK